MYFHFSIKAHNKRYWNYSITLSVISFIAIGVTTEESVSSVDTNGNAQVGV
jgi:hypothetical protein